jgi:hypothetical protein
VEKGGLATNCAVALRRHIMFGFVQIMLISACSLQRASHLGTSIVILVALCFIPASFIIYPVQENLNQEKRLQFVYGVGPVLYWLTTIFCDMVSPK